MKRFSTWILMAILAGTPLAFVGCEQETPAEERQEEMGDRIEDATDDMGDSMEELGDDIESATD